MLLVGAGCSSGLGCLARWIFLHYCGQVGLSLTSVQQTTAGVVLLCIPLELLDAFMLATAGCRGAPQMQLEPGTISGSKVTF